MKSAIPKPPIAATAAMCGLFVLASCGSTEEAPTVAQADDVEQAADDSDVLPTTSPVADTTEEALLGYSRCMREEGVAEFPDPVFLADGSFSFPGPGSETDAEIVAAQDVCKPFLDAVNSEFTANPGQQAETSDRATSFAECMRSNGVDFPDPVVTDSGDVIVGSGGAPVDASTPEFQDAWGACESLVFGGAPEGHDTEDGQ